MSFLTLKEKIKSVLATITDIAQVEDYPTQDFNGFPAVVVRTDGNTSEYESTRENDELYSFTLFLFAPIEQDVKGVAKTRELVEGLCDTIRDTFDSNEFLSGVALPTNRTMLGIRPTVSRIYEADNGKYVTAEINLSIRISKLN
jgi:hypothetical protein